MTGQGLRGFLWDEIGAVTIDWVALVSATLLLGIAVVYSVFNQGVASLLGEINATLAGAGQGVSIGAAPDYSATVASGAADPGGSTATDPPHRSDDDDD